MRRQRGCKDLDELGDPRLQQVWNWARRGASLVYSGKGVDAMATRVSDGGEEETQNEVESMACGVNETTWPGMLTC